MPTRFYFPGASAGTPGVSPAYDSEWEHTSSAARRKLSSTKISSVNDTSYISETSSSSPYDILFRQYISEPLAAQTISGTVKGQWRVREDLAAADMCRALVIKVVSGDGGTVRGTLLSHFPGSLTSEYATSLTNRKFPPETTLTEVTAQAGDLLVIEIGTRAFNASTTPYYSYWHNMDDTSVSDLPEDETTTTNLCNWIEFSQTLQFQTNRETVCQNLVQAEYTPPSREAIYQNVVQIEYVPTSGPVLNGYVQVSLEPSSEQDAGIFVTGSTEVGLSPSSSISLDLHGSAPIFLEPSAQVQIYETVINGYVAVSLIPAGEEVLTLQVLDGNVAVNLIPSGDESLTLQILEGNVAVSLSPTSQAIMPLVEVEGSVGVEFQVGSGIESITKTLVGNLLLSLSITHLEVVWDLSGGLEVGGEAKKEILGPDSYLVEMAGGVQIGDELETDIPRPLTYSLILSGGLAIGNGTKVEVFDPGTLAAVTLSLAGGAAVGGSLAAEAQYVSAEDLILAIGLKGGVKVGEIRRPPIETTAPGESEAEVLLVVLRGGPAVGGDLQFAEQETVIFEFAVSHGGVRAGGGCVFLFLVPPVFETELYGGVTLGGGLWEDDSGTTETWVLCGYAMSPALFTNFDFNSYCQYRHQFYGAKKDGIYLLEGDSDDGRPIFSGIRIGPTNLGVDNLKRLRAVYPGAAGNPELRVKGEQGGQEAFYPLGRTNRFDCGREVEDRVLTLDIQDFDEISHLEIIPLILSQR